MTLLRRLKIEAVSPQRRAPVAAKVLAQAAEIVEGVRLRPNEALREYALRFGDLQSPDQRMIWSRDDLQEAWQQLDPKDQQLLQRCARRVEAFAYAQKECLQDLEASIPGGKAGHSLAPVERAGCYAPGGRFPLPSSVLMTAITARVAGVQEIWVASPKPTPITLAAAAISGADALLAVGGAQAIAALAYGTEEIPACDAIVGPGNAWVTAAKQLVAGHVAIDMLAGPSELVVVADHSANPQIVAADLLAQAEHDTDAVPILIALDESLLTTVEAALTQQLADLPTAQTARTALQNGFVVLASDRAQAATLCNRIGPEHLQLSIQDPQDLQDQLHHYGALFLGEGAAEVLGDYCAGPNHVLPTGGTARSSGGLSVFHFLRVRTWMRIDQPPLAQDLVQDAIQLARHEGLEAHARAASYRLLDRNP